MELIALAIIAGLLAVVALMVFGLQTSVQALHTQGKLIMTAISDFAAKQTAYNTEIAADLSAIQTQIQQLNTQITTLQNSPGPISADDQATLDSLQAAGTALQAQADAVANKTPPAPPVAPATPVAGS
jgi:TolA-binding protein